MEGHGSASWQYISTWVLSLHTHTHTHVAQGSILNSTHHTHDACGSELNAAASTEARKSILGAGLTTRISCFHQ